MWVIQTFPVISDTSCLVDTIFVVSYFPLTASMNRENVLKRMGYGAREYHGQTFTFS